ncbi:hypothetical protein GTW69_02165, partial [Streptomyces sp. SID7760]|nr:hypothetical protein [Streptomyces sp. SID7760]
MRPTPRVPRGDGIPLRPRLRHVSELLLGPGGHSRFQAGVIAERQGLTQTRRPPPEGAAPGPGTGAEPGTGTEPGTAAVP